MPSTRPEPSDEARVFLTVQRTAAELMYDVAEFLRPVDLSPYQYNVLRILRGAGEAGLPCGEIGERMIARVPDVTRLVDRLEKRSLVTRGRDPDDRRVILVTISTDGRSLLAELDGPLAEVHRRQFEDLGRKALRTLEALLAEVRRGA